MTTPRDEAMRIISIKDLDKLKSDSVSENQPKINFHFELL